MSTKQLLAIILFCALVSTLSSAAALFLVIKGQSGSQRLEQKILAIEAELASPEQRDQPMGQPNEQAEKLSASLNLIFQKLSAHEQSLERAVRAFSDRTSPRTPVNGGR